MRVGRFVDLYPQLFHLTSRENWSTIRRLGLLSTQALLDLFDIQGGERAKIMCERRLTSVRVEHPKFGAAVIRDQKPLAESALQKCLDADLEPSDWYRLLNEKVFFWATRARVDGLLKAKAYRKQRHVLVTVDTASLVESYEADISITTINTGSAIYNPAARGLWSFQQLCEFDYDASRKKRGRLRAVAEIAVEYAVPNILDHTIRVDEVGRGEASSSVWVNPTAR